MNPYVNEDVAWQRMKDLQREMENSRLLASAVLPAWAGAAGRVLALGRRLAGRLARLAFEANPRARVGLASVPHEPRAQPVAEAQGECESEVA